MEEWSFFTVWGYGSILGVDKWHKVSFCLTGTMLRVFVLHRTKWINGSQTTTFANIVIRALFTLCRMCKTNLCNSALWPETSQCSEIQPWRSTVSLLCSQKWCWVNGSLHSVFVRRPVGPCRRWEPSARVSVSVLMHSSELHRLGGFGWLEQSRMPRVPRVHVCGQCAREPGGRRAIPPPCSGFIRHSGGQSEELFPGTYPALLLP